MLVGPRPSHTPRRYDLDQGSAQHTTTPSGRKVGNDVLGQGQQIVAHPANSTTIRSVAGTHRRLGEFRQGQASNSASSPTTTTPLDDDPDVVRIRLGKVGWTNGRRFGDVWPGSLAVAARPGRYRRTPSARGQHRRPPTWVAIEVVNRLCPAASSPGRALVRRLRPGRPARQPGGAVTKRSPVPHARPPASQGSHRKRSENTLRRPRRRHALLPTT